MRRYLIESRWNDQRRVWLQDVWLVVNDRLTRPLECGVSLQKAHSKVNELERLDRRRGFIGYRHLLVALMLLEAGELGMSGWRQFVQEAPRASDPGDWWREYDKLEEDWHRLVRTAEQLDALIVLKRASRDPDSWSRYREVTVWWPEFSTVKSAVDMFESPLRALLTLREASGFEGVEVAKLLGQ